MSEFVSVYNVVFGGRPVEEVKSEFGNRGIEYKLTSSLISPPPCSLHCLF